MFWNGGKNDSAAAREVAKKKKMTKQGLKFRVQISSRRKQLVTTKILKLKNFPGVENQPCARAKFKKSPKSPTRHILIIRLKSCLFCFSSSCAKCQPGLRCLLIHWPKTALRWVFLPQCGRSTIDLLYSWGFTIFICTWSALQMNVPADCDTTWAVFIRKLKWMTIGILIPEYVAVLATTEWWDARYLQKEMRTSSLLSRHAI
jgi:hypothetical protein